MHGVKPYVEEMDRVKRAGGWSVGGRVCGILAVSRAFGDYEFKGGRFDLLEVGSPSVIPSVRFSVCGGW